MMTTPESRKITLSWRRIGQICFLVTVAAYVVVCGDFYVRQERYLLEPEQDPTGMRQSKLEGQAEEFELVDRRDGEARVFFRRYMTSEALQGTVFYLHGNRGDMDRCEWEIEFLIDRGYDVWTMDYRGFGRSSGSLSEAALRADALQIFEQIVPRDPALPVMIWGRSFGSGIASSVAAATKNKPDMLILETPYWSLVDTVRQRYPFLPPFLFRYELPVHHFVRLADCPVHLIHGTQDEKVPANSSDRLHELEGVETWGHSIMGGKHNLRDERTRIKFEEIVASILE